MILLDITFIIFILVLAQRTIYYFSRGKGIKCKKDLQYLWLYHLLFGLAYFFYVSNFGGDALGYWRKDGNSLESYLEGGEGTAFIHVLNYPLVEILNLSFFTGSILYTYVGFLGIVYFYLTTLNFLKHDVKFYGYKLFPLVFFLPNMHFWSAGVGKDTLSFFCIGLLVYCTIKIKTRVGGILFSLLLLYYVRPHIAVFILAAYGLGVFFDRKLKVGYKIVLSVGFTIAAALLIDNVIEYVKLDEISAVSIEQYSNNKVAVLSEDYTGSSVDITSYPLPLKIFTFLFRPLFFDVHNMFSFLASVENLILLFLTFILFRSKPFTAFKQAPYQVKALVIFLIIGTLGFSMTMGNTGIMMRMKNMFTPALLIFILFALNHKIQRFLLIKKALIKRKQHVGLQ